MMFYLLYENTSGENTWEIVYGEDAMQIRVSELMNLYNLTEDEIIVFDSNDQL